MNTERNASHYILAWLLLLPCIALFGGCAATIAPYDTVAYQNATGLKVETLSLIDKASEPYEQHASEATELRSKLQKAEEYSKGIADNGDVVNIWQKLVDDDGILGRFFAEWMSHPITPPKYLNDKKGHVSRSFDRIIALEGRKSKPGN